MDLFAEMITRLKEGVSSPRRKLRKNLKKFEEADFQKFYDHLRDKLGVIKKEVLEMEEARRRRESGEEEEDWIINEPKVLIFDSLIRIFFFSPFI